MDMLSVRDKLLIYIELPRGVWERHLLNCLINIHQSGLFGEGFQLEMGYFIRPH